MLAALIMLAVPAAAQAPAGGAQAQDTGGATGPEGEAPVADAPLVELLRVLRDETARATLIDALERATAVAEDTPGAEGEGGGEADPDAAPAEPGPTIGRRIAEVTREGALSLVGGVASAGEAISTARERLEGLAQIDLAALTARAREIGLILVATVATFLVLRVALAPIWRALGALAVSGAISGGRSETGPEAPARAAPDTATGGLGAALRGALAFAGSVLADAATVVLAWALGYVIAFAALGQSGDIGVTPALFLNAFLVVELAKVVLRALIAPNEGRLRPLPLTDEAARRWSRWAGMLASLVGYGHLLVVPVVSETASRFAGLAASVAIDAVALLIAAALVIAHRRAPAAYLRRQAEKADGDLPLRALATLAQAFWLGALAWLVALFVASLRDSGGLLSSLGLDSLRVIAVVAAGGFAMALLARAARHGVALPGGLSSSMPMLERRLNAFVPMALKALRLVILVAVVCFAVDLTGLYDLSATLNAAMGGDAAARVAGLGLILVAGFAVWLALVSWIDWRLQPRGMRMITSRETTLLGLLRNAGTVLVGTVTLMFALSEIGIDIAPLLASAGVVGLAIGFGAQKLVQDIITGIFIQFENAINVGEVVTLGGHTGVVEKLTIRSVSLRDLQGVFHVIPSSSVDAVSNYMRGFAYHVADLGIAYREDVADGRRVMEQCFEAMRADPDWRGRIVGAMEWFGVQSLGDSAVVLRARLKTTPGDQWAVGRRYNELLKAACDREGIEIPFPHLTLWMGERKDGGAPTLGLRAAGGTMPDAPAPRASAPDPEGASRAPALDMPGEAD
ncbi:MAG: mechanosensitive ion channel domain-containing protein [Paracoccaceae bacterium]